MKESQKLVPGHVWYGMVWYGRGTPQVKKRESTAHFLFAAEFVD